MEAAKGDTNFFVRSQLVPSLTYRLVSVCVFVCVRVSINILVCVCVFVCVRVSINILVCVCLYVYVYL